MDNFLPYDDFSRFDEPVQVWLRHLVAENRISSADLFRLRMLEPTSAADALLLSLLFVSLREGSSVLLCDETSLRKIFHSLVEGIESSLPTEKGEGGTEESGALSLKKIEPLEKLLSGWSETELQTVAEGRPLKVNCTLLNGTTLSFQRVDDAVERVAKLLAERLRSGSQENRLSSEQIKELHDELYRQEFPDQQPDPHQQKAVLGAVQRKTTVITGGPGTGKTTVVVRILRLLLRLQEVEALYSDQIALVAPTGRAAARLRESVLRGLPTGGENRDPIDEPLRDLKGTTLHRLLGYRPDGTGFRYNRDRKLPHRLVVVDESSMVDLFLFQALLEALNPECRLILLGDPHQLPSVDVGAVLGDLSALDFPLRLVHSFRTESKAILDWAGEINDEKENGASLASRRLESPTDLSAAFKLWGSKDGSVPILSLQPESEKGEESEIKILFDAIFRQWHARFFGKEWRESLAEWSALLSEITALPRKLIREDHPQLVDLADRLTSLLDSGRLLSLTRVGNRGTVRINTLMEQWSSGSFRRAGAPFAGKPVIITQNDPSVGLFNGDVGVLLPTRKGSGSLALLMKRGAGEFELIPVDRLPAFESAYAMTVHKSQGSEYGEILLVLPEEDHRLLSREILYTAATRSKYRVSVVGSPELFERGCKVNIVRQGGVGERLKDLLS